MKHKNVLLFAILALVLSFPGCGQQARQEPPVSPTRAEFSMPKEPKEEEELPTAGIDENPADADKLFEISDLQGDVTDFSGDGCTLSPAIEVGDNISYQAEPGYEDTFVSVLYHSDCTFQIAHVNHQTATATYEPATVKDIKKQTSLILCGEYDEKDVFHASRVYIYRAEGM